MDEKRDREIEEAIGRGTRAAASDPRAVGAWYDADPGRNTVDLTNGVVFGFPFDFSAGDDS